MSFKIEWGTIEKPYLCRNQTGDVAQSLPIVCGEESRALYAADCGGIRGGYQGESWEGVRADWIRIVSLGLPPRARVLCIVWGTGGLENRKPPSLGGIYGSDGERGYDTHVGQSMEYELAGITHMVNVGHQPLVHNFLTNSTRESSSHVNRVKSTWLLECGGRAWPWHSSVPTAWAIPSGRRQHPSPTSWLTGQPDANRDGVTRGTPVERVAVFPALKARPTSPRNDQPWGIRSS